MVIPRDYRQQPSKTLKTPLHDVHTPINEDLDNSALPHPQRHVPLSDHLDPHQDDLAAKVLDTRSHLDHHQFREVAAAEIIHKANALRDEVTSLPIRTAGPQPHPKDKNPVSAYKSDIHASPPIQHKTDSGKITSGNDGDALRPKGHSLDHLPDHKNGKPNVESSRHHEQEVPLSHRVNHPDLHSENHQILQAYRKHPDVHFGDHALAMIPAVAQEKSDLPILKKHRSFPDLNTKQPLHEVAPPTNSHNAEDQVKASQFHQHPAITQVQHLGQPAPSHAIIPESDRHDPHHLTQKQQQQQMDGNKQHKVLQQDEAFKHDKGLPYHPQYGKNALIPNQGYPIATNGPYSQLGHQNKQHMMPSGQKGLPLYPPTSALGAQTGSAPVQSGANPMSNMPNLPFGGPPQSMNPMQGGGMPMPNMGGGGGGFPSGMPPIAGANPMGGPTPFPQDGGFGQTNFGPPPSQFGAGPGMDPFMPPLNGLPTSSNQPFQSDPFAASNPALNGPVPGGLPPSDNVPRRQDSVPSFIHASEKPYGHHKGHTLPSGEGAVDHQAMKHKWKQMNDHQRHEFAKDSKCPLLKWFSSLSL